MIDWLRQCGRTWLVCRNLCCDFKGAFTADANEALRANDLHVKSMQRRDRQSCGATALTRHELTVWGDLFASFASGVNAPLEPKTHHQTRRVHMGTVILDISKTAATEVEIHIFKSIFKSHSRHNFGSAFLRTYFCPYRACTSHWCLVLLSFWLKVYI